MLKINIKKIITLVIGITLLTTLSGFNVEEFTIDHFDTYEKEFKTEEMSVCYNISAKTYMPYTAITKKSSPQYKEMVRLFRMHQAGVNINLQCFCAPNRCHGETIRAIILEAFEKMQNKKPS